MKKSKRLLLIFILMISLFSLSSCSEKEKVFNKCGITVTLTTAFHEVKTNEADVSYVSNKYGFAATVQSSLDFIGYDLEKYAMNVKNK